MPDERDDRAVEELLARYQPAAPDAELRERVLAAAPATPFAASTRPPIVELAAGLLIAALLQWVAADREKHATDLLQRLRDSAGIEAARIEAGLPPGDVAWWQTPPPVEPGLPEDESLRIR